MVKVRMKVSMAGTDESWKPKDEREVEDHVAEEWARLGIAAIVDEEPSPKKGKKSKKG